MMNLYGGQGMGASGMGASGGGMVPGASNGMTPQMLALLQQMSQGGMSQGGSGTLAPAPGPLQAPATGTPMAGYIGAPQGAGMMQNHAQMAPVGQPPGMNNGQNPQSPASAVNPQIMQLLQMLKNGQTGVPASGGAPGQLPAAQNPNAAPSWLQQLMGAGSNPPAAPGTGNGPGGMT